MIGVGAVGVAPFAVVLVQGAVAVAAEHIVAFERHAAALADKLPRRAEKRVDGHIEQSGKQLERFGIRHRVTVFPARYRLPRDKQLFGKLVLRKPCFRAQG